MLTGDRDALTSSSQPITLAETAAEQLFNARNGDVVRVYEPMDIPTAQAAVRRFGQLFEDLPGSIADALDAAQDSGELLSNDRLQGIAEVIQNADDVAATKVRLSVTPTDLWLGHNGNPVRLRHVLGFATPWLSTKGGQTETTGRFGIGLMTLRALSDTIEVHCHPYHFGLGKPTITPVDLPAPPPGLDEPGWTTLRVPLGSHGVSPSELEEWLDHWEDSALLFLRQVTEVSLLDPIGATVRKLAILRRDAGELPSRRQDEETKVAKQRVEGSDGRSWIVYSEDAPSPSGVSRHAKRPGRRHLLR